MTETATIQCGITYARLTASPSVCAAASEALQFPAPGARYSKAFQQMRWDGRVRLGVRRGAQIVIFPAGLTVRVASLLQKNHGVAVDVRECERRPGVAPHAKRLIGVDLREYQEQTATVAVAGGRMYVKSPTGTGKTEIGAEIVRRLGLRTLWVVHRADLLSQTVERLEKRLGVSVGTVGGGKCVPQPVTVGMVQTLSKIADLAWWQQWDVLVLDECHHAAATTWLRIADRCTRAAWRFGLSATPTTGDPLQAARLEGATGPMYVATTIGEAVDAGFLARPRVVMLRPPAASYPTYEEVREAVLPDWRDDPIRLQRLGGQLHNEAYERGITRNVARNDLIAETVAVHVRAGEKVLVLCTRLEHGTILHQRCASRIDPSVPTWWLAGSDSPESRTMALREFKARRGAAVMVASMIFQEGLDVPEIDALVLAGAGKAELTTIQRAGRALRPRPDKSEVLIYDVLDGHSVTAKKDYLALQTASRLQVYRDLGFEVEGV